MEPQTKIKISTFSELFPFIMIVSNTIFYSKLSFGLTQHGTVESARVGTLMDKEMVKLLKNVLGVPERACIDINSEEYQLIIRTLTVL